MAEPKILIKIITKIHEMKILIKIVTRITEHFSQHCNVDSPFQGFTKIVTTICKPNTSLPKMLTKVVAKIHEWKILT